MHLRGGTVFWGSFPTSRVWRLAVIRQHLVLVIVACLGVVFAKHAHAEGEKALARFTTVEHLVVRDDGKVVMVGLQSKKPLLRDAVTGQTTKIGLRLGDDVTSSMPSFDGKYALVTRRAVKGEGTPVSLFEIESGKELWSVKAEGRPFANPQRATVSPDGSRVAFTNLDTKRIVLLDMTSGKAVDVVTFDQRGVWSPRFSTDGKQLAAITATKGINQPIGVAAWDTTTWKMIHTFGGAEQVEEFVISPDGKSLVAISEPLKEKDWRLRLWSMESGKEVWNIAREGRGRASLNPFRGIAIGKNSGVVAVGTRGAVLLFDAGTGKELGNVKLPTVRELRGLMPEGEPATPSHLSLSPDGKLLAVTFCSELTTNLYDLCALKK